MTTATAKLTNLELGKIMLKHYTTVQLVDGYTFANGTDFTDPETIEIVGQLARSYNDINPDGTLN